jgi:hypothetical protein
MLRSPDEEHLRKSFDFIRASNSSWAGLDRCVFNASTSVRGRCRPSNLDRRSINQDGDAWVPAVKLKEGLMAWWPDTSSVLLF